MSAFMGPTLKEALAPMGPTTRVMEPTTKVTGPIDCRVMGPPTKVMGPITSKGHMELDTAHQGVVLQLLEPQIMAPPEVAFHPLEMVMPLP